jgi:hypothetical protein
MSESAGTAAEGLSKRAPWLFPALVAVVGIVPAGWALYAQSFGIFGRDQGIFQYVAWALRHGERVYRDIHEINGPLPHAWHYVMQVLGGEDEHTFRTIDTVMRVIAYAFAATTLPRWIGLELRRPALIAWAGAGLTVLGAQYVRYDWWHTSQREAFYSVLVLTSLACQAIGHTSKDRRRAILAFAAAALTTSLVWFGKPPCAIFSVLQAGVLWLDRKNVQLPLRTAAFVAGTVAVVVGFVMLAFVLAFEDLRLGIDMLSKVPSLHHTIWNETLLGSYRAYGNGPRLDWAMATFIGFIVAYRVFRLPRRALLVAVLPAGGFVVFAMQGKAFPYHLHMLTLGTAVGQLAILAALIRHVESRTSVLAFVGAVAALGLGAKAAEDSLKSPAVMGKWTRMGATADKRASRAYFEHFPWGDFFANDLRDGAAYLTFHTRPDERVQIYGFDPYMLFLARRKSATPIIYSFELNVDAALEGGPGSRPPPELRQWLTAYRDETERFVLKSVEAAPPAAFVLFDRAPFTHPEDSEKDFEEHCPDLFRWMKERYLPTATFGTVRIWLRRDVAER